MPEARAAWGRILIHAVVWLLGAAYLVPLIVVVLNSLRTAQEIAQTSMIGWPQSWAFENYAVAWSRFCVAQTCEGIRPFMWNSAAVTLPATLISTLIPCSRASGEVSPTVLRSLIRPCRLIPPVRPRIASSNVVLPER